MNRALFVGEKRRWLSRCDIQRSFETLVTGRNEVVAKVMFLQVCVCPQGGGVCLSACWDAIPPDGEPPPDQADPPLDQADPPGARQTTTPPGARHTPPGPGRPPPGKQTPAYGLRAAGTHPTGMHSCSLSIVIVYQMIHFQYDRISVHSSGYDRRQCVPSSSLPRKRALHPMVTGKRLSSLSAG